MVFISDMLNCQLCINENGDSASNSKTFSSLDQLEAHLAADHFSLLPYECEHCQFAKFPTEFAVMKHNEMDHDNRSYSFRCRITPEVKDKRRKMREFLLKLADKDALPKEHFNGRNDKKMSSAKKRKAKEGKRKNNQSKIIGEEREQEEKPKRMCLRPRPFSLNGTMETNSECASEGTAISLPIVGEGEEDETEADNEGNRLLTNKLKEQQADVQEILRATAVAVSQFGGPKKILTPPIKQSRSADESYSLRPKRFTPYALLHNGIPIPTENDIHQIAGNSEEKESIASPTKKERKRSKSKTIAQVQCRKCNEMVNARGGCLSHHTNARHLRLPMFHCKRCKRDFFEVSNSRILKHISEQHEGEAKYLVNNYHKFSSILHATRDECFGEKGERIQTMGNGRGESNKKSIGKTAEEKQSAKVTKREKEEEEQKDGNEWVDDYLGSEYGEVHQVQYSRKLKITSKSAQCKDTKMTTEIAKNKLQVNVNNNENDCRPKRGRKKANDTPTFDKYSFLVSSTERHSAEFQEQNLPKNDDNQRIRCKVCGEMVWNQTVNRLNHVNVRHLQLPLHQCTVCDKSFTSYSRSACHTHVQFAHKAEIDSGQCSSVVEEHIISRKEAYDDQLMETVKECF